MNTYEQINEQILDRFEKRVLFRGTFLGKSRETGLYHILRGNPILLSIPFWINRAGEYATFQPNSKTRGKVKKGAHGEAVYFYKPIEKKKSRTERKKLKKA